MKILHLLTPAAPDPVDKKIKDSYTRKDADALIKLAQLHPDKFSTYDSKPLDNLLKEFLEKNYSQPWYITMEPAGDMFEILASISEPDTRTVLLYTIKDGKTWTPEEIQEYDRNAFARMKKMSREEIIKIAENHRELVYGRLTLADKKKQVQQETLEKPTIIRDIVASPAYFNTGFPTKYGFFVQGGRANKNNVPLFRYYKGKEVPLDTPIPDSVTR